MSEMEKDENQNIAVVKRVLGEFWSEGKAEIIPEVYTPEYTRHDPYGPGVIGHDAILELLTKFRDAIPDLRFTIEKIFGNGDMVAAHYWMQGTHKERLLNIEANGDEFTITGTSMFRLEDGKVAEDWHSYDFLLLLQSLGVVGSLHDFVEEKF